MDTSKQAQQSYDAMVKKASPNSPILSNCIKAFVSGGLICVLGQALLMLYTKKGDFETDAALWVSITLIGISAVLTAFGLYESWENSAAQVRLYRLRALPIPLFPLRLSSKKEGGIRHGGENVCLLSQACHVYGTLTSMAVGLIYYLVRVV